MMLCFLGVLLWTSQLVSAISNHLSNGDSVLGTVDAPTLPHFLQDDLKRQEYPAGWNSPAGPVPNTGKTRYYDFTISRSTRSPDGFSKSMILVNGAFPAPTIEANWGDTIKVKVTNKITEPEEGTTLHWHGFLQLDTPWYDGVPGVSQCPIAPGDTFTYEFKASQYGTSWYHSHVNAQYMDGVFGPMVVHGPSHAHYDVDVGPILLADWAHDPYVKHIIGIFDQPPYALDADNNLINGKNPFNCSLHGNATAPCVSEPGNIAKFNFQDGKTHLLRLINAGRHSTQKFTIDDHEMQVIANDFVPIKPYTTKVVTIGVGQRTDVLVRGKRDPYGAYWLRSDMESVCLNLTAVQPNASAAVYYPKANTNLFPRKSNPTPWTSNACKNDPLEKTQPLFAQKAATPDSAQKTIDIIITANETGFLLFEMNNSSAVVDYNEPLLPQAISGNDTFGAERNVYDFKAAKYSRIMFRNYNPYIHPMHLHGHNFQILAEGTGDWNGRIVNPANPQRRDTHLMPPGTETVPTYMVMQWEANNPGVWPLHCHLLIHSNPGLIVNILERPDLVTKREIPKKMASVCKKWDAYTRKNVVDQIGSGFRLLAARD